MPFSRDGEGAAGAWAALRDQEKALQALASLSRYECGEEIGKGATSTVYRARDRETGRDVALKVLHESQAAEETARSRFRREARAGRLSHPNIVTLFDVGELDGRPCLVLEFVQGTTLSAWRREDPILRSRIALLEKIARAVHYAHGRGMVHRDLKPANILVTDEGEPKIIDFGLAQWRDSNTKLTRTGSSLGTPSYMAPEQVDGGSGSVGPWTDIYALGAILYEILAGRPPHVGRTIVEVLFQIKEKDPTPVSKINPGAPRDLEIAALKALQKDPRQRYPSAEAFADDLRRHLSGEPVLARPFGPVGRARRLLRRHPRVVAAGLLASAVSFFFLSGFLNERAQRRRQDTETQRETVVREARTRAEAEALRRFEEGRASIESASLYLYDKNADPEDFFRAVEAGRDRIQQAIDLAPHLPTGHHLLGVAWELLGWDDRAEASWRRAIAEDPGFGAARLRLGEHLLTRSYLSLWGSNTEPGMRRRAREIADEGALEIEQAIAGGMPSDGFLQKEFAGAMLSFHRNDFDACRRSCREALDSLSGRRGSERFLWLLSACEKGNEDLIDQALRIRPHYPLAFATRAFLRDKGQQRAESISDYENAVRWKPRFLAAYDALGVVCFESGEYERAITAFNAALEAGPDNAWRRYNRGVALLHRNLLEEALRDLDRAVELNRADTKILLARAAVLWKRGDASGSLTDLEEAIRIDPRCAKAYFARGSQRQRAGELREAIDDYEIAIALDPDVPDYPYNRAICRSLLGEKEKAAADCGRALGLAPPDWKRRSRAETMLRDLTKPPAVSDEE